MRYLLSVSTLYSHSDSGPIRFQRRFRRDQFHSMSMRRKRRGPRIAGARCINRCPMIFSARLLLTNAIPNHCLQVHFHGCHGDIITYVILKK